ncbi:DUF4382 domain-containing protein [Vibrio fluvialis]|nr:DUF4382 domain-containing protein [Vibrio fluvialis]
MKILPWMALSSAALLLAGCGGGDDSSVQTSKVSFSVSDAPVDSASSVTIGFTQVELVQADGSSIYLDVNPSDPSMDYEQIDLMDYQGTDSKLIITSQSIPVGTYKNLILHISTESNVNFVVDEDGTQALKQSSNKLQLGSFTVSDEATQAFTIEFDLRYSLVMRGSSGSTNGYILKPHGVSIVSNDEATSLSGTVDPTLFDEGTCSLSTGKYVYLYQGSVATSTLGDLVDESDSEFNTVVPDGVVTPYSSTEVADDGSYAFGYLPEGDYTVAFNCDGDDDSAIQYDGLTIPNPDGQVAEVTLTVGATSTVNFTPVL